MANSFKEQRVRDITLIYYSQPEVRKAIFKFSKDRECIPKYFEVFGKRPDTFQYEGDILEQVKKGATSFHCSEELWEDPFEVSTEMSRPEFDSLRIGWDLLLDIDSPYLEYSKIYAKILIETLKFYGIKNFSIKFSGSKGFHILIPWKAFPEKLYNQQSKDMFPEWPRIICEYLSYLIQPKLAEKILEDDNLSDIVSKTGKNKEDLIVRECISCKRPAEKKDLITWICPYCRIEREILAKTKRIPKCPECRKELLEKERREIFICEFCNISSQKNPEFFEEKERFATEKLIDADLILVAPRHLFRMPYSLHEKTALASIVIDKDKIDNFQITDAKPFRFKIKDLPDFYPTPKPNEAKELLLQALDWKEQQDKKEKTVEEKREKAPSFTEKKDFQKVVIENPSDEIFPPQIQLLLKGIKQDGRKRALFILLSFFKCLGADEKYIEKRIFDWNELNYTPLKKGYIQSQLNWYRRNPDRLPPNFDNSIYRELGVDKPDQLSKKVKNPVAYAVKKFFMMKK